MKQIAQGFYTFTGLMFGRAYLIEDSDGLTMVDTSIGSAPPKILSQLQEKGYKASDVKRILITHAHPDHIGGLRTLKEKTGAQVVAYSTEADVIEGRIPVPRADPATLPWLSRMMQPAEATLNPIPVDRRVEDGEMIAEAMGGLIAIATPGHSVGHVAFWQPDKRILILGDVLFNTPRLRLPPYAFSLDMDENRRSIQKVAKLSPEIICFGHGVPIVVNAAAALKAAAQKFSL